MGGFVFVQTGEPRGAGECDCAECRRQASRK